MGFIKLLIAVIVKAFIYKKYAISIISVGVAAVITGAENLLELQFFGISYSFLMLATILIIVDFFAGAIASKHEKKLEGLSHWWESNKIQYTVYKFLSVFLLLWLTNEVYTNLEVMIETSDEGFSKSFYISASTFLSIARGTVFFLICGREFSSIGENIERRFGKKPYIFNLFEKILDVVELKLMKKIENSDICKKDE